MAVCSVRELVSGDDDLPVCSEVDNDRREEQLFSSLSPSDTVTSMDSDPDEDDMEVEPPAPKLRSLSEAISDLEDMKEFLDSKGYAKEAISSWHCHLSTL